MGKVRDTPVWKKTSEKDNVLIRKMQSDVLVEISKYIESYMGTKNYTYHVIQTNIIPPHYVDVENLKRRRIQNRATKRNYSIRRYPHGTLYVRERK